jgi:hypothetical protein
VPQVWHVYTSAVFKAVEVDARSRRPTGLVHELQAASRGDAVARLLELLGEPARAARLGPNGRSVQVGDRAWLIVPTEAAAEGGPESASGHFRRAGAKHRGVR